MKYGERMTNTTTTKQPNMPKKDMPIAPMPMTNKTTNIAKGCPTCGKTSGCNC